MPPELPGGDADTEGETKLVQFGGFKTATVPVWLAGILDGNGAYIISRCGTLID